MKRIHYLGLALTTGIMLFLAWPPQGFTWLVFFAFVPLLSIEHEIHYQHPKRSLFWYAYLAFFTWNGLTTWWIWNSSAGGAAMAILANSLLMSLPFIGFHRTSNVLGRRYGYVFLLAYWLMLEYLHFNWELTWTWLTLGNVISTKPQWAQWYEFTGAMGGTVWILVVNFVIFWVIRRAMKAEVIKDALQRIAFLLPIPLLLVLVPIWISVWMYNNYQEPNASANIVVVQPNIDPYNEKFGGLSRDEQLQILLDLSKEKVGPETDYLVWPETAVQHMIWLDELNESSPVQKIRDLLRAYPNVKLVAGFAPFRRLNSEEESPTARKYSDGGCCYDAFNSAMQIDSTMQIPVYHKSKLVVGVERMPYPSIFRFLEPLAINLGGSIGSLATQEDRSVFFSADSSVGIAPVICYESVMGSFMGGWMRNGANYIFIITNDGWWGNTPGHVQHYHYASLRAIEARRSVARSANTGISCFVNQRGDISQPTKYWESDVISGTLNANSKLTFYSQHGDYLGRIGSFLGVFFILLSVVRRLSRKKLPQSG